MLFTKSKPELDHWGKVSKPRSKIVARYCVPSFQPIRACEISQRSKLETSLWAFALPLEVTNTEK